MGYSDWTQDKVEDAYEQESIVVGDFDTIPVVDISGMFSDDIDVRKKVAAELREACTTVGFFYMENHGIPKELVDAQFEWGKRFFDLPFEQKMEVYIDNTPHFRGYTPLQGSGKPGPDGKGNANEAFDFGHDSKLNDDPNYDNNDPYMRGENPWPTMLPGFEEQFSQYYRTLRDFCRTMTQSVALSLGLPEDYFMKHVTHPGCSSLIAIIRPKKKGLLFVVSMLTQTLNLTERHTVFTILAPGDVRALEVQNRSGQWISAPPREGCFIVNVGDQLQTWTNDLYVSTRHRVMNYSGQERYSVPFFFSANFETVIEPIPELITSGHKAKYSAITAGQMYKDMMTALHRIAATQPELVKYRKPIAAM